MTDFSHWTDIHTRILQLERDGLVTRTFRRLDPERQQAVLVAILDDAVEKGPTNINVKRIAERSGVSVGSLYQYFGSREKLLDFTVELCVRYMSDMFNASRPYLADTPLRQALNEYMAVGIEWSRTQVGLIQFFLRAAYQGDPALADRVVRPIGTLLRDIMRDMLAAAVKRGEIREDVDLDAVSRIVNALTLAVGDSLLLTYLNNYFQVIDADMPMERILGAMMELILRGIGTGIGQDDIQGKTE